MRFFERIAAVTALCVAGGFALFSSTSHPDLRVLSWREGQPVTETTCDNVKLEPKHDLVLLGETTHGSEELRALNACLIKRLILEHGFTNVLLEYDFTDISQLDLYIHNDARVSKTVAFEGLQNSFFNSQAFFDLFEWLRAQNKNGQDISVYGIDNWSVSRLLAGINAYATGTPLERCINDHASDLRTVYAVCSPLFAKLQDRPAVLGSQTHALLLLKRALEKLYLHDAYEDQQAVRDANMYALFSEIRALKPTRKTVIAMHVGHALPYPRKFGEHLVQNGIQSDNYVLTFCKGEVSYAQTSDGILRPIKFNAPEPQTLEAALCQRRAPARGQFDTIMFLSSNAQPPRTSTPPTLEFTVFTVPQSHPLEVVLK
jgi:erythromycin esterase-like protein